VIPGDVLALIEDTPQELLPGTPTSGHECQGAKFHSPRPMVVHPVPMPQNPGEMIYLCGTCLNNVQLLVMLQERGTVPWTARRCFGNLTRAVADSLTEEQEHA
jgi:hypothetical protein